MAAEKPSGAIQLSCRYFLYCWSNARLVGLAQASKIYRQNKDLSTWKEFSNNGDEIAWGTIGNASTSEGHFFEAINAAGVLQIPMIISVWDDEYGISVHSKHQTTKENISEILKGFQRDKKSDGFEIIQVKGCDYPALINAYEKAEKIARKEHVPVLIHVVEMTQPQGHSTSGSHERYKSKERLKWEDDFDCIKMFEEWIVSHKVSTKNELEEIRKTAKKKVSKEKNAAWKAYQAPIASELALATSVLGQLIDESENGIFIKPIKEKLDFDAKLNPHRKNIFTSIRKALRLCRNEDSPAKRQLKQLLKNWELENQDRYNSHLYSESVWLTEQKVNTYSLTEEVCAPIKRIDQLQKNAEC